MKWEYRFPAYMGRDGEGSVSEALCQNERIHDEVCEARDEIMRGNRFMAIVETMDAIHCAETNLRMMAEEDSDILDDAYEYTIMKNKHRGYYTKEVMR